MTRCDHRLFLPMTLANKHSRKHLRCQQVSGTARGAGCGGCAAAGGCPCPDSSGAPLQHCDRALGVLKASICCSSVHVTAILPRHS